MKLMLLGLVCSAVFAAALAPEEISRHFHLANQSYSEGNYRGAIEGYEKILKSDPNSGGIHFNLGNAYFRSSELGKAIFHYRQARNLLPRDAEVKFNLDYARQKTVDQIEEKPSLWDKFFFLSSSFNEKEAMVLLIVAACLFWITASVLLFYRAEWLRWSRLAFLFLFLITLTLAGDKALDRSLWGAVISKEAKVYSAGGRDNVVLFTLHEGTEFVITQQLDKWAQVTLVDGKKGWISTDDIIQGESSKTSSQG